MNITNNEPLNYISDHIISSLNTKLDEVISDTDQIVNKANLFALTDEDLIKLVNLFGIQRLSLEFSSVLPNIIMLTKSIEIDYDIEIPIGTKFYVSNSIYIETLSKYTIFSNEPSIIISGILNVSSISSSITATNITRILTTNTEINTSNFTIELTKTIENNENNETDEELRQRFIDTLYYKGDNTYNKIISVINTNKVGIYKFLENNIAGYIEVIISPPEIDRFDEYKINIETLAKEVLKHQSIFLKVKEPDYVIFNILQYNTDKLQEIETYINKLHIGTEVSYSKLLEIDSDIIITVDNVQLKDNYQLKEYQKSICKFIT